MGQMKMNLHNPDLFFRTVLGMRRRRRGVDDGLRQHNGVPHPVYHILLVLLFGDLLEEGAE